jgi:vanillate O-demethylase monooxygenase subunit
MTYLRNTWYVAAWCDEVSRDPLGRKLLDQDVVLYRKEDGDVVAIGNRCPHRFAPLSMGKLQGDTIECPYHGLRFNGRGACVLNPNGDGDIPPKAKVPAYRVEERHDLVWFWGGDPEQADPALIPDLSYVTDPKTRTVTGHIHVDAAYELYIDNLIDLSHAQFVHNDQLGVDNYEDAQLDVKQADEQVNVVITIANANMPPAIRGITGEDNKRGNFVLAAHWQPPSIVTNHIQFLDADTEEPLHESFGSHLLTPETETTAHYFYGLTRRHRLDDEEVDNAVRAWHLKGFTEQDKPVIEAAARMMGDKTDPLAMGPAIIQTDGANVRARRILKKRIKLETELESQA